jgi:hypothetical protein
MTGTFTEAGAPAHTDRDQAAPIGDAGPVGRKSLPN